MKILTKFQAVLIFIVLAFLFSGCPSNDPDGNQDNNQENEELFTLTILHTNDMHARIREINKYGNTVNLEEAADGDGIAGVARLATSIAEVRAEKENVLLLDAGDWFQGSLFYSLFKGMEAQKFMNILGYDAMTLGNHEFDGGVEALGDFIEGLDFKVVSANVDCTNEPELADLVKVYETRQYENHKVGIFGITTPDVPLVSNPGPNVVFEDQMESAIKAVQHLELIECDIIIMLSHSGLGKDMEIAGEIDGIDIIVGGHTHSWLSNADEDAEGPYPVVVESPSIAPVLIVQAKSWGRYLGNLDVEFDASGIAQSWDGEPITQDQSVVPNHDVLAEVNGMAGDVDRLSAMGIGNTTNVLDGSEEVVRHHESNLGSLIADAIFWETESSGTQIAFFNGGGIRAGIPAGDISMAQALEVLPFTDTIATFQFTGRDIRELLEFAVSRAEDPMNEGTGRWLHFSGLKFTWNPDKPVGERIVEVSVIGGDGKPELLDDGTVYYCASSGFLRGGGDGYDLLEENAIDPYDFGRVISDVVVEYIELNSPLTIELEGRIGRSE